MVQTAAPQSTLLAPRASAACSHAAPRELYQETPAYDYYCTGDPADVQTPTRGGTVLMGGASDVDAGFRWMIDHSGGGNFVVLRASGADEYDSYIYNLGKVASAETIVCKDRSASFDPFVLSRIQGAEAIFLAGGDQSDYVHFWKDTPVQAALNDAARRGVPLGGISAGLAVLGNFAFTAEHDELFSDEALGNPRHPKVTLDRDFLHVPTLQNTVTDTHFSERQRMGRLVTFLADTVDDAWAPQVHGVGVDEGTAVMVEPDGKAAVTGDGSAWFLTTPGLPERCVAGYPLEFHDVPAIRVSGQEPGAGFDFASWKPTGPATEFRVTAADGQLSCKPVPATQPPGPADSAP